MPTLGHSSLSNECLRFCAASCFACTSIVCIPIRQDCDPGPNTLASDQPRDAAQPPNWMQHERCGTVYCRPRFVCALFGDSWIRLLLSWAFIECQRTHPISTLCVLRHGQRLRCDSRHQSMITNTHYLAATHWPFGASVLWTGLHELRNWCEDGYAEIQRCDLEYSDWFAIPRSIKTTSIKPSGTVSLLAGATPGLHFPESRYYIRRVRLPHDSELVPGLRDAGYAARKSLRSTRHCTEQCNTSDLDRCSALCCWSRMA